MKITYQKKPGLSLSNQKFNELTSVVCFTLLTAMIILAIFEPSPGSARPQVLPVEVLEQPAPQQENAGAYHPEKLQEVRRLTTPRIVGLVVMWIVVITFVITIRIHLRREKILLIRGYYHTDPTQ